MWTTLSDHHQEMLMVMLFMASGRDSQVKRLREKMLLVVS